MKRALHYLHWAGYLWYIYIFGYAGLFKIFHVQSMVDGMAAFGFDLLWNDIIGCAEVIGVAGLIVGFWKPKIKNLAILWLFPFAIGAITAHMAHREYDHFFNSLAVTLLSYLLLATDKHFKIILENKEAVE